MLVNELIQEQSAKDRAIKLLAEMDWAYDIDMNEDARFNRGERQLKKIKGVLAEIAKNEKDKATELWNEYCPWAGQQPVEQFLK